MVPFGYVNRGLFEMKPQVKAMLDTIRSEAMYTASCTGRKYFKADVMQALAEVDREKFVDTALKKRAYDDGPLPIACGQTISQPYIVALMTDLLDLSPQSRVLEIGTGSGYQTAVLSCLAQQVYSVEKISQLAEAASRRLSDQGYSNIHIRCSNGYFGWPEEAPYDAIIVTAAATHVPNALIEQLKPEGRLVIPIGLPFNRQELFLLIKNKQGNIVNQSILDVAFVPLVDDPEAGRRRIE